QSWNTGVCVSALWGLVTALMTGVNTIVWADNMSVTVSPIWCDIASHIQVGSDIGVPVSSLIITRRLYKIVEIRSVDPPTGREKRNELLVNWFLGLGFPVIVMGLYHIVEGARFQVLEELGCLSTEINTGLTILFISCWSVILPTISIVFYCPKIFCLFYHHNKQLHEFLRSHRTMPRSRYFRLLTLGCVDAFITLPVGIMLLAVQLRSPSNYGLRPITVSVQLRSPSFAGFWPGWSIVHSKTDWPPQPVSAVEWGQTVWSRFGVYFDEWICVLDGVLFFAFF
ncbi:GPCR fungal pheromone mating factor, partial [Amylostereum chailletii]